MRYLTVKIYRIYTYLLATLLITACSNDSGTPAPTATPDAAGAAIAHNKANTATVADTAKVAAKSYSGPDMAGIYFGMSPDEVELAMKNYAPDITIKEDLISFDYNALGTRYKTDSFTHYIAGNTYGGKLSLDVRFSYPPGSPKVVGVSRGDKHKAAPIPQAVYVESLIEKYGPPALDTGTSGTAQNATRTLEWPLGNGSVQCLVKGRETATEPVLDRMVENGKRNLNPTPEFTQQCISMLRYVLRGEPVLQANGTMFDVVASANAEFDNRAWIQSLIDMKSSPGTEKPKL
jgi:hypothetical protein